MDIANEPIDRFALDQVTLLEDGPDLTAVIREICAKEPRASSGANATKHVRIHARTGWDCIMTMRHVAGTKCASGWSANATRALKALAGIEGRPVVLWLEEIRLMKVEQREDFVFMLENIAWQEGINLRVVMLVGKSRIWVGKDASGVYIGKRKSMHCYSEKLDKFATPYDYDGKRITEDANSTPLFAATEHEKVQALKTA